MKIESNIIKNFGVSFLLTVMSVAGFVASADAATQIIPNCYLRKEYNYPLNQWTTNEVCNTQFKDVPDQDNYVSSQNKNAQGTIYLGKVNYGNNNQKQVGYYTNNTTKNYGSAQNYLLSSFGKGTYYNGAPYYAGAYYTYPYRVGTYGYNNTYGYGGYTDAVDYYLGGSGYSYDDGYYNDYTYDDYSYDNYFYDESPSWDVSNEWPGDEPVSAGAIADAWDYYYGDDE
jgi:hypothetical protein